ncbi:MAG: FtsW/RodA/SpoVE family cell cycle protein [Patescibacteria group bacterium]
MGRINLKLSPRSDHAPDFLIIVCTVILVVFGLIMLTSASSELGKIRFGDSYFYLKHQIIYGLFFGIIGYWLGSKFYYKYYHNLAVAMLLGNLVLLFLIFSPLGLTLGGATRWLVFGPIVFQPSEFLKITFIIYIASWLGKSFRQQSFFGGFFPFLLISGIVTGALIFQPSTSSAAILLITALIVYFASGARVSYIFSAVFLGIIMLAAIVYMTPYRWERIKSFINPAVAAQSSSYQINQAFLAIGSGGMTGVGYGKSTTKLYYLPQPIDDSIFAIIAEELGFAGAIALISVFTVFIIRILILAGKTSDNFGKLILIGFGSLIAIQSFVHMGAISGVIPLTGVPLPYISYGGTALAIFMTISGIIVNISKYPS